MACGYKWQPSKTAKREFAAKMAEIDAFCSEHNISQSASSDSYYFTVNGKSYRVSNHTIEASNRAARDPVTGEQRRACYHPDGRAPDVCYIHAGKTRIMEIYNDLVAGFELDGRGQRKKPSTPTRPRRCNDAAPVEPSDEVEPQKEEQPQTGKPLNVSSYVVANVRRDAQLALCADPPENIGNIRITQFLGTCTHKTYKGPVEMYEFDGRAESGEYQILVGAEGNVEAYQKDDYGFSCLDLPWWMTHCKQVGNVNYHYFNIY